MKAKRLSVLMAFAMSIIAVFAQGGMKSYRANGVSFEMVEVKGGMFTMGATAEQGEDAYDDERPAHEVTLNDFLIGKTEVTQELWQAVMGSNPSSSAGVGYAVDNVSWEDCEKFLSRLNQLTSTTRPEGVEFRLPTEAEWEYAARGGVNSNGYKYAGSDDFNAVARCAENVGWGSGLPCNVATKQPNELGLYDMSGNVAEWCQDWSGDYKEGAQTDPKGPAAGKSRVARGGGLGDMAQGCRVSSRAFNYPHRAMPYLGLRLCMIDVAKESKAEKVDLGAINVRYEPVGSSININGKIVGKTPRFCENMEVGDYTVVISHEGYESAVHQVKVVKDKVELLSGMLRELRKDCVGDSIGNVGQGVSETWITSLDVTDCKGGATGNVGQGVSETGITSRDVTDCRGGAIGNVGQGVSETWITSQDVTDCKGGATGEGGVESRDVSDCMGVVTAFSVPAPYVTGGGVAFKMQEIKGGTLKMGETGRLVTVGDYMIGVTEVTQLLWLAVMGDDNDCSYKGAQNPINSVSYFDCVEFIKRLNALTEGQRPKGMVFRLPTEAEWEFAAQGGNCSESYRYAGSDDLNKVGWYAENAGELGLQQVAQRLPNELGLFDMSGNVWEWCCQKYTEDGSAEYLNEKNMPAEFDYCIVRGGSYSSEAKFCKISFRDGVMALDQGINHGLRVVLAREL